MAQDRDPCAAPNHPTRMAVPTEDPFTSSALSQIGQWPIEGANGSWPIRGKTGESISMPPGSGVYHNPSVISEYA